MFREPDMSMVLRNIQFGENCGVIASLMRFIASMRLGCGIFNH